VDNDKKSILVNFSQKTIHHLNDTSHSFMYSHQILLCIGKCDVVLSAFNITNLCYFPVSYLPDH
jgi:L-ascorbate metabolism protein UlaG (beta-lactamase superfamily)